MPPARSCATPVSPHAIRIYDVSWALSARYVDWPHFNRKNPLDELLFIICSIQTNEVLYRQTFANLKKHFPTFKSLAEAKETEIVDSILEGGLASQKARAIKRILEAITEKFGRPTLAPLRIMSDEERERYLTSLPGVGLKTARCVMMYSLGSHVFPVDLHCWRICRRLGWVRATRRNKSCSKKDMDRTQEKIPPELRFRLHVNMVSHGRTVCTAEKPTCSACCIARFCRRIGVTYAR